MDRFAIKLAAVLLLFVLLLPCVCRAQGPNVQGARKFDEFGDLQMSDLIARLDNWAIQLQQEPTTRGFIVSYRTRRDLPGLNGRLADRMKRYLVYTRGIEAQRIVSVDGGIASSASQELWIVNVGSTPTPRSDVYSGPLIDTESALKFDEYFFPSPRAGVDEGDYPVGSSLEAFAEALRKYPRLQGHIIAYAQYRRGRVRSDPAGTAQKMLRTVRSELVNDYKIPSSRISTVNGGHRKLRQVELWLVPLAERPPIPTPNSFPKKRR